MIESPEITQVDGQQTAIIRATVPREHIRGVIDAAVRELKSVLSEQGAEVRQFFMHHVTLDAKEFDVEIGFTIDKAIEARGNVQASTLPACRAARTIYHGSYDGLFAAWDEFGGWLKEHQHHVAPHLWELYTVGPNETSDVGAWRTELLQPLLS